MKLTRIDKKQTGVGYLAQKIRQGAYLDEVIQIAEEIERRNIIEARKVGLPDTVTSEQIAAKYYSDRFEPSKEGGKS